MREESFPGEFKKLEDKITELVQTYRDLRQTKSDLEAKIHHLESVLKVKTAAEIRHAEDKSAIRSKIESLLSRIDQVVDAEGQLTEDSRMAQRLDRYET